MHCPVCGEKLSPTTTICPECGAAQKEAASSDEQMNEKKLTGVSPTEGALREFVGPNDDYYYSKWGLEESSEVNKQSWNWAAFFLSTFWLGYRKMYVHVTVIFLIFLLFDATMYITNMDTSFDFLVGIAGGVFFGMFGNYLYFIHASKKIAKHQQGEVYDLDGIRKSGGRSVLGIFIVLGLMVCYSFITTYILAPALVTSNIEFGSYGNGIVGDSTTSSPSFHSDDEIYYFFYFPDKKGGIYTALIEKNDDDKVSTYNSWTDEAPLQWIGHEGTMKAPKDVGEYTMKILKKDKVVAKGTFIIN